MPSISSRAGLRWTRALALLFWSLGGAAGCASLAESLEPPTVSVVALELVDSNLTRQRFRMMLQLDNPNGVPMPIRSMSYDVQLLGQAFANGGVNSPFTLPANGSETVAVDVSVDALATLGNLTRALRGARSAIDYRVNGTLQVDLPFAKPIAVVHSGQVPLMMR